MKTIRILLSVLFFLGMTAHAFSQTESSSGWKIGTITDVKNKFIEIDSKLCMVSESVIIKSVGGDELGSNLKLLSGVEKILYIKEAGKIVEIRIFQSAQ